MLCFLLCLLMMIRFAKNLTFLVSCNNQSALCLDFYFKNLIIIQVNIWAFSEVLGIYAWSMMLLSFGFVARVNGASEA